MHSLPLRLMFRRCLETSSKNSVAALKQVCPGTFQRALDPCQRCKRREVLPRLDTLPVSGAETCPFCHLFLGDRQPETHASNVLAEPDTFDAVDRLLRWHPCIVAQRKSSEHEA